MNKKDFIICCAIVSAGAIISVGVLAVSATLAVERGLTSSPASITYPVSELGNCGSESACKRYCDKPTNIEVCLAFAEKNNLMSQEDLQMAKKFSAAGNKGPGGCNGKNECDSYCNDIDHMDECISFAESSGLIPPEELAEAKKVQSAIRRGVKPPPCKGKKECDTYCDDPNNMEVCISFGAEAGFIQGKELEDAKKMLAAVKRGVKPPPCKGREACDEYCSAPENIKQCMTFAMEAGFMDEKEKGDAQKMLSALEKGVKPPACKGRKECDEYCQQDEHFEECLNFAEAAGFMKPEEAVMARKTGGKGPGGCKGKEVCEAFCQNPDNQEECFRFGAEHGLIPEEDLKRMEEGKQQMKGALGNASPEVIQCLESALGSDSVQKIKDGTYMPGPKTGDTMKECFEKNMPQGQLGPPGQGGPGMPGGPGMNFGQMNQEMMDCLKNNIGENAVGEIQSGKISPDLMEKAKTCFEQFMPQTQQGPGQKFDENNQMMQQNFMQMQALPEECKSDPSSCLKMIQPQYQQGMPLNEGMPLNPGMAPQTCTDPNQCPFIISPQSGGAGGGSYPGPMMQGEQMIQQQGPGGYIGPSPESGNYPPPGDGNYQPPPGDGNYPPPSGDGSALPPQSNNTKSSFGKYLLGIVYDLFGIAK